jgi:putative tryptophan/tyrosine transport system substrate-binding protein
LSRFCSPTPTSFRALRDGLRGLGYVEGKNVVIESRYVDSKFEKLPDLAAELVRASMDVTVAASTIAARAAKGATSTIPIVTSSGDPLGTGLVASLAHPGANVTGISSLSPDLSTKRLALIKEVVLHLSRVAVLWNSKAPVPTVAFKETQAAAETLGLKIQSLEVTSPDDFVGAFETAKSGRAGAVLTIQDPMTRSHPKRIVDLAAKNRLPAIYPEREFCRGRWDDGLWH